MSMNVDMHTLALVLGLTILLQVIILFIQYRVNKSHFGPGWWTIGSASMALAFAFNSMRGGPGFGLIAIVLNNALFVLGLALFYVGVLRFFGRPERRWYLVALCGVATLVAIHFTYFDNSLAVRRLNISVAMAGLSFLIAWSLFVYKIRSVATSANFLAVVFLVNGGLWAFRGFSILSGPSGDLFSASMVQATTYLAAMMTSTLWTFGFIVLVNQRLNAEYREAKETSDLIFNTSPDAVMITRVVDGQFVDVNDGFSALSGYTRAEVIGKTTLEVEIWKNQADRQQFVAALQDKGFCENMDVALQRKNGSQFIGMMSARLLAFNGEPHIITVTHDITERRRVQEALRQSNLFLSEMIENNGALIFVKDFEGRYELVNKKWEQATGMAREAVLGKTDMAIFAGNVGENFRRMDLEVMQLGKVVEEEEVLQDSTGERNFLSIKFPLRNQDGTVRGLCGISTEITQRKQDERRIQELVAQLEIERNYAQHSALTDGLTRLANRRHFDDLLNTEFYRLKRSGAPLSLIMLDVDHFKRFNDRYGHVAGDDCLRRVGYAMKAVVGRGSDLAARYGGEEFAVILPETDHIGARTMAERIRRSIEELAIPHADSTAADCVTVSLGVVTQSASELVSPEKMIELADEALYRGKQAGRNRVEFSGSGLQEETRASGLIRLVWREAAESGNAIIDAQHRALFDGSNGLLSAVIDGSPKDVCGPLMEKLLAEVVAHFRDEEDIIRAAGFPFAEHHARCHTELVAKAVGMAQRYERDELLLGELFSFLAYDVVAQHMFMEDRKFFPYLEQRFRNHP